MSRIRKVFKIQSLHISGKISNPEIDDITNLQLELHLKKRLEKKNKKMILDHLSFFSPLCLYAR